MNDAEYEAAKDCLQQLTRRWGSALGMNWWQRVANHYHRDDEWFRANGHIDNRMLPPAAVTKTHWAYKQADINWHMPSVWEWMQDDPEQLEYAVIHEFMHCLTQGIIDGLAEGDEIPEVATHFIEHVATDLSQAFIWVREAVSEGDLPVFDKSVTAEQKQADHDPENERVDVVLEELSPGGL